MKGKIYVGYSGVGKTTYCSVDNSFIDLESSHFYKTDGWEQNYISLALHLTYQGYNVFVSAHDVVRKFLRELNYDYLIIAPSVELKDLWLDRLERRYKDTLSDKDYRAFDYTLKNFESSVLGLMEDARAIIWLTPEIPYLNAHPDFKQSRKGVK